MTAIIVEHKREGYAWARVEVCGDNFKLVFGDYHCDGAVKNTIDTIVCRCENTACRAAEVWTYGSVDEYGDAIRNARRLEV